MDKLAKRAGVAALIVLATAGSAFAWGLGQFAGSIDRPDKPQLKMGAALKRPKTSLFAAVATPKPQALEAALAPAPDLTNAIGKTLGTSARKASPHPQTPKVVANDPPSNRDRDVLEPRPDDLLDFGPGASDREAKLSERGAKAFSVRQPGGAEQEHKLMKDSAERVTFETDLAKPGDH